MLRPRYYYQAIKWHLATEKRLHSSVLQPKIQAFYELVPLKNIWQMKTYLKDSRIVWIKCNRLILDWYCLQFLHLSVPTLTAKTERQSERMMVEEYILCS